MTCQRMAGSESSSHSSTVMTSSSQVVAQVRIAVRLELMNPAASPGMPRISERLPCASLSIGKVVSPAGWAATPDAPALLSLRLLLREETQG